MEFFHKGSILVAFNSDNFQMDKTFNDLNNGTYLVKLKNGEGCVEDTTIKIYLNNAPCVDSVLFPMHLPPTMMAIMMLSDPDTRQVPSADLQSLGPGCI